MIRRAMTYGPMALTVAASALLMGAEPVTPRPLPPLPVPPVEHRSMPPYLARITISGDSKMTGVFESCVDMAATGKAADLRAKARPADALPTLTGCTSTFAMAPGGSFHMEMTCDPAKGAKAGFHVIRDGTANDMRMHMERSDSATGTPKTTVLDSHLVRLGACPADLKPGEMRRIGGPVIESDEASRFLDAVRGTPR